APLAPGNADVIFDFFGEVDKIALDGAVFAGLNSVHSGNLVFGAAAVDADDRLIYDQLLGQLFYDSDGSGAGAAILLASLVDSPSLAVGDFVVLGNAANGLPSGADSTISAHEDTFR